MSRRGGDRLASPEAAGRHSVAWKPTDGPRITPDGGGPPPHDTPHGWEGTHTRSEASARCGGERTWDATARPSETRLPGLPTPAPLMESGRRRHGLRFGPHRLELVRHVCRCLRAVDQQHGAVGRAHYGVSGAAEERPSGACQRARAHYDQVCVARVSACTMASAATGAWRRPHVAVLCLAVRLRSNLHSRELQRPRRAPRPS